MSELLFNKRDNKALYELRDFCYNRELKLHISCTSEKGCLSLYNDDKELIDSEEFNVYDSKNSVETAAKELLNRNETISMWTFKG